MKNWRDLLVRYDCKGYLTQTNEVYGLFTRYKNIWFCTGCSKTKGDLLDESIPRFFYVSSRLLNFYKYCEQFKLKYGILSDKYGIHLMDESLPFYDIHPSDLNVDAFKKLGLKIAKKAKDKKIDCFVYYNPSPIMGTPYFKMLHYSGIPFYYISKRITLTNQKTFFNL